MAVVAWKVTMVPKLSIGTLPPLYVKVKSCDEVLQLRASKLVKHKVGAKVDGAHRLAYHDDDFALFSPTSNRRAPRTLGPNPVFEELRAPWYLDLFAVAAVAPVCAEQFTSNMYVARWFWFNAKKLILFNIRQRGSKYDHRACSQPKLETLNEKSFFVSAVFPCCRYQNPIQ